MKTLNLKSLLILWTLIIDVCLIPSLAQAKAVDKVAKAIIVKGQVKGKLPSGAVIDVKKHQWVPEGTIIQTGPKSFAKLLFNDKSQMNLGPKSQMVINKFKGTEAGIITLMKGQLRSKVTKNYADESQKDRSKLFIKTKTAAMGVRGTDFLVTYNNTNKVTSLITFSGEVRMAKIDRSSFSTNSNVALERIVSSKSAAKVTRGLYAGANPNLKAVTAPVKISPAQLETLKNNDGQKSSELNNNQVNNKQFRSPIPPGVDSKEFSNESEVIESKMAEVAGPDTKGEANRAPANQNNAIAINKAPKVEGARPGGFVDIGTGLYIPPPEQSTFDKATGVYIPPQNMGTFDSVTGDYKNDNYDLKDDGTFVEKKSIDGRSPASATNADGKKAAMPIAVLPPPMNENGETDGNNMMSASGDMVVMTKTGEAIFIDSTGQAKRVNEKGESIQVGKLDNKMMETMASGDTQMNVGDNGTIVMTHENGDAVSIDVDGNVNNSTVGDFANGSQNNQDLNQLAEESLHETINNINDTQNAGQNSSGKTTVNFNFGS